MLAVNINFIPLFLELIPLLFCHLKKELILALLCMQNSHTAVFVYICCNGQFVISELKMFEDLELVVP